MMLTRNSKILKMLKSRYPTILYDIRNTHAGSDDILDAALLAALNQWKSGVKELCSEVEVVFSKLLLTEKMVFTLKMFSILKYNKHSLVHQSIQILLALPKVRSYVQWQQDQPQLERIMHAVCLQCFEPDQRPIITDVLSQPSRRLDETAQGLQEEMKELVSLETQNFLWGLHSTTV